PIEKLTGESGAWDGKSLDCSPSRSKSEREQIVRPVLLQLHVSSRAFSGPWFQVLPLTGRTCPSSRRLRTVVLPSSTSVTCCNHYRLLTLSRWTCAPYCSAPMGPAPQPYAKF